MKDDDKELPPCAGELLARLCPLKTDAWVTDHSDALLERGMQLVMTTLHTSWCIMDLVLGAADLGGLLHPPHQAVRKIVQRGAHWHILMRELSTDGRELKAMPQLSLATRGIIVHELDRECPKACMPALMNLFLVTKAMDHVSGRTALNAACLAMGCPSTAGLLDDKQLVVERLAGETCTVLVAGDGLLMEMCLDHLHVAAMAGKTADVKKALAAGCELEAQCRWGISALELGAFTGHVGVVRALLSAGAKHRSALHLAVSRYSKLHSSTSSATVGSFTL